MTILRNKLLLLSIVILQINSLLIKHPITPMSIKEPYISGEIENEMEIRICVKGIDKLIPYIAIKDQIVNINSVLLNKAYISKYPTTPLLDMTPLSISKVDGDNTLYLSNYDYFYSISPDLYYCLYLYSNDPRNLKNIQISTLNSTKAYSIASSISISIPSIFIYNLNSSNKVLSFNSDFSLSQDNDIYYNSQLDVNLKVSVTLPDLRTIPTSSNGCFIILELNDFIEYSKQSTITSTKETQNLLETRMKTIEYQVLDTKRVLISNMSEDLVNNRVFPLVISKLQVTGIGEGKIKIKLYWTNTNSLMSSYEMKLFSSIQYSFATKTISNINNISLLYTNSNFPMRITFKTSIDIAPNDKIWIKNTDSKIIFIPSTCDFSSIANSSSAFCNFNRNDSKPNELIISGLTIKSNIEVSIGVWIFTSAFGIPIFKISVGNKTIEEILSHSINIMQAFPNLISSFDYNACISDVSLDCENRLIVKENTGNFALMESSTAAPTLNQNDKIIPI